MDVFGVHLNSIYFSIIYNVLKIIKIYMTYFIIKQ